VCGGLAQYLNTDATLIRVLFVVLALLGGPGIVIYLLMWIIVPEEPLGAASQGPRFTPSLRHLRSRTTSANAG
jgi:phage shock protein C